MPQRSIQSSKRRRRQTSVVKMRLSQACVHRKHAFIASMRSSEVCAHYNHAFTSSEQVASTEQVALCESRFRCLSEDCGHGRFSELLPDLIRPHARRTHRLAKAQTSVGFAARIEAGAGLLACWRGSECRRARTHFFGYYIGIWLHRYSNVASVSPARCRCPTGVGGRLSG